MLHSADIYKNKPAFFVIDEAHCIMDWGEGFWADFKKLFQLRSTFPQSIMLALSATVTKTGQQQIAKALHMTKFEAVCACPARTNILLQVQKRPSPTAKGNSAETPYSFVLLPILKKLKEQGDIFPLTIVYCKTMQWIGYAYEMAFRVLREEFYGGDQRPENARVAMFYLSMERDTGKVSKT